VTGPGASERTALPPELAHYLAGADGAIQRVRLGAYAWCERDGAVLLTRISPGGPGAGQWTLPGGGLDFGEDPADGAIREVREETGYDVVLGDLLGIRSHVMEPDETISGHRLHVVGIVYAGSIAGGELQVEYEGSTDLAAWVAFAELDALPSVDLVEFARRPAGH
jgi:ADP-ribose pyrophosphatase YjhB (NUDIX family)